MTNFDAGLLADRTPLPSGLDSRLLRHFTFLIEVDKLKTVLRASPLAAADRRENDAEHSWHLALMVLAANVRAQQRNAKQAPGAARRHQARPRQPRLRS